ncbi:hypothetical protein, partial [Hungatella effluvii]|uniref:hypothetical protein n=1 Tax=Hungatella effluvii TaxID=1096246 RepID=UPI003A920E2C
EELDFLSLINYLYAPQTSPDSSPIRALPFFDHIFDPGGCKRLPAASAGSLISLIENPVIRLSIIRQ